MHYLSFVVFVLITVHGIFSGTDASNLMWVYLAFAVAVYFLTMYRIFQSIKQPASESPARRAKPPAAVPSDRLTNPLRAVPPPPARE